jgi:signal transduction histidine kinase
MKPDDLYSYYQDLQRFVQWTEEDGRLVAAVSPLLEDQLLPLIEGFYENLMRFEETTKILTASSDRNRLRTALLGWLRELFSGRYDADFVARRWRVGWRHVEVGLNPIYMNAAVAWLRQRLFHLIMQVWKGPLEGLLATLQALNKLLDLDLAIIEAAYQAENAHRQQQHERLAALGRVSAGIAHELRNPLNVVKTSVYYLCHAPNLSREMATQHLERIDRQVDLANNVITTLSGLTKMPVPDLRPCHLESCLKEALETNPIEDNIQVILDCPPSLPAAMADPSQIRIVLGNLIRNAADAMPQGGLLRLQARLGEGVVEINVCDSGCGIPAEDLARIMEPLYSTKAKGLGLGLAMAHALVEKNRGNLSVAHTSKLGTTFTVRLPLAKEEGMKDEG